MILEQAAHKTRIVSDIRLLINLAIEVYSGFFIKDEYHLTRREKEFFIGCVLAYHKNIGLSGRKFTHYMIKEYGFADNERSIYNIRDTIKRKKWLQQTQFGYDIPPLFKQELDKFTVSLSAQVVKN